MCKENVTGLNLLLVSYLGFPNVIGAIDGTHVRILRPAVEDHWSYRNRKGFFSLNVQVSNGTWKLEMALANWESVIMCILKIHDVKPNWMTLMLVSNHFCTDGL